MFALAKMKQLQTKLPRTAVIERKLLTPFDRRVKSVITAAEKSGRSSASHGKIEFIRLVPANHANGRE